METLPTPVRMIANLYFVVLRSCIGWDGRNVCCSEVALFKTSVNKYSIIFNDFTHDRYVIHMAVSVIVLNEDYLGLQSTSTVSESPSTSDSTDTESVSIHLAVHNF